VRKVEFFRLGSFVMLNKSFSTRRRRGFTLLELMIVIGIIATLAAILTPILIRARFKTYHSACVQNERNLATALQLYALENDQLFPTDLITVATPPNPFIKSIPTCPSTDISYTTSYTVENANSDYTIICPGQHDLQLGAALCDPDFPQVASGIISVYRLGN
jgi:prepilin-type N-terminal cleavage/methylation domain-containing protein